MTEYQHFLIAQLIVFDTVNARFLWKRIPKSLKEDSSNQGLLKDIWEVGKALIGKEYD